MLLKSGSMFFLVYIYLCIIISQVYISFMVVGFVFISLCYCCFVFFTLNSEILSLNDGPQLCSAKYIIRRLRVSVYYV